jgi:hypothetical protein
MKEKIMTEPLSVLSLGAGVQSTTLLLMMLHDEIPRADHVIFADTGWEPQKVYEHLENLKVLMEKANMPFHMVSKGNIRQDFLTDGKRYASMPLHMIGEDGKKGMVRRQCTAEYKLGPLMKKQRELAGLKSGQRSKEHLITTVIGISWDEVQRVKDPQFSWIQHDYPLVDGRISRQDCLDWCADKGYALPPRSACIGCPFKNADEWRALKAMPEEWADAVEFDEALRTLPHLVERYRGTPFLHSTRVELRNADLRTNDEKGIISLFDQECEGMCGL